MLIQFSQPLSRWLSMCSAFKTGKAYSKIRCHDSKLTPRPQTNAPPFIKSIIAYYTPWPRNINSIRKQLPLEEQHTSGSSPKGGVRSCNFPEMTQKSHQPPPPFTLHLKDAGAIICWVFHCTKTQLGISFHRTVW